MLLNALNLLSFDISRGLEYMDDEAMENHTVLDIRGIVLDRHKQ